MANRVVLCRINATQGAVRHNVGDTFAGLPTTGLHIGAQAWALDTATNYIWNGTAWQASGSGGPGPEGPPGSDGADGADGRSVAVFQQAGEPLSAIAGDLWIVSASDVQIKKVDLAWQSIVGPAGADGSPGADGGQGIQGVPGNPGAPGLGFGAIVKLTADLAAVTTTALADATGLSFALTANRYYSFQFWIRFTSAATTTGAQFAINAPANSHIVYRVATSLTNAAAGVPTFRTARAVNVGNATASAAAVNSDLLSTIEGMVRPTANGTLIVRVGTEVAGSGITVKAGSCGMLMDYGT